jgi:hypothetical protein
MTASGVWIGLTRVVYFIERLVEARPSFTGTQPLGQPVGEVGQRIQSIPDNPLQLAARDAW